MNFFIWISQYFWLVCIGIAAVNFLLSDRFGNTEEDRGVDRDLRRKYLAWFYGLSIIPWLVVGFAQLTGAVPYVWAYFRPQDGNPYVWTFYGAILVVYIVGAYWVLFRDGARIAAELRLVKTRVPGKDVALSAFWIKVFAIASFPFFALWLWIASLMDVNFTM